MKDFIDMMTFLTVVVTFAITVIGAKIWDYMSDRSVVQVLRARYDDMQQKISTLDQDIKHNNKKIDEIENQANKLEIQTNKLELAFQQLNQFDDKLNRILDKVSG